MLKFANLPELAQRVMVAAVWVLAVEVALLRPQAYCNW